MRFAPCEADPRLPCCPWGGISCVAAAHAFFCRPLQFATLAVGTAVYFSWNRKVSVPARVASPPLRPVISRFCGIVTVVLCCGAQKAAADLAAAPSLVAVNRNVAETGSKAAKYTQLHTSGA